MDATDLRQLYDRDVVDSQGSRIGSVLGVWADAESGALEFIGIHTSAFTRGVHVIPARENQTDGGKIMVPYDRDLIESAPRFSHRDVLSRDDEEKIYSHFGSQESANDANSASAERDSVRGNAARGDSNGSAIPDTASAATVTEVRVRYVGRPDAVQEPAATTQADDDGRASVESLEGTGTGTDRDSHSTNSPE